MHTFMFQRHSYKWHFYVAKLPEMFWLMTLFQFASLLVKVPAACIYLNLHQSLLLLQLPLSFWVVLLNHITLGCSIACMGLPITFISWRYSDKWHHFRLQHWWYGATYLYLLGVFWWMTLFQVATLPGWGHLPLSHGAVLINDTVSGCNIACVASPTFIWWSCSDEWYYVRLQHRLYGIT